MVTTFEKLMEILQTLEQSKVFHALLYTRENAVTISATVPGQRWEIDVFSDGEIEVEIFTSDGTLYGQDKLDQLVREFSE